MVDATPIDWGIGDWLVRSGRNDSPGRQPASGNGVQHGNNEALAGIGHRLGAGIASLCNVFGSDFVVIGGGFGVAGFDRITPAALETAKRDALDAAGATLQIVRAELGTMAGLIGAGLLAFSALP